MMRNIGIWLVFALIICICGTIGTSDETNNGTTTAGESSAGWNGSWQSNMTKMDLIQTGSEINGTYVPLDWNISDPGAMKGTVSEDGKIFTGTWDESGTVQLTLSEDGKLFNGTYRVNTIADFEDEWNGVRINPDDSATESGWNGTFQSDWYRLNFTQDGNNVTAAYEPLTEMADPGVISGTLSPDGKTLTGTWTENGGVILTLSDDDMSFNGTYGYGSSTNGGDGFTWNGVRVS
jgi:hypothetical protein